MMANRPTVADYCANCGSTGACKKYRDRYSDGCVSHARPLTQEQQGDLDRLAAIDLLTKAEMRSMLRFLSLRAPESTDYYLAKAVS
jgi:recombinational DNA repair protein (RecF pathway)